MGASRSKHCTLDSVGSASPIPVFECGRGGGAHESGTRDPEEIGFDVWKADVERRGKVL